MKWEFWKPAQYFGEHRASLGAQFGMSQPSTDFDGVSCRVLASAIRKAGNVLQLTRYDMTISAKFGAKKKRI